MKDKLSEDSPSPKENVTLSVILVNYNGKEYIEKCLDSIKENISGIRSEIIVVDNHSTDGSAGVLERNHPDILFLRNHKNVGFSKANNQGLKASSGEYVLLINPDTLVCSNAIKKLLAEIQNNPDIGGVGPALLSGQDNFQISFGGKVNFFSEAVKKTFLNRLFKSQLKKNPKKRNVKWLSAACFMSSRDILKKAGMFDERFFLYFEDIDLCMRIRKRGWRLVYLPKARIFHTGGASTNKKKLKSRFHYRKSQLYFYRKHSSALSFFLLRIFLCMNFIFILFQGLFKRNRDFKDRLRFFRLLGKQG
ncbi:MAG: glycosyltransferase family 2 protein [Acidobacteriota bacterium]